MRYTLPTLASRAQFGSEMDEYNQLFDMLDPMVEGFLAIDFLEASCRWVHKSRRTTWVRGKEMVFRSEKQFLDRAP